MSDPMTSQSQEVKPLTKQERERIFVHTNDGLRLAEAHRGWNDGAKFDLLQRYEATLAELESRVSPGVATEPEKFELARAWMKVALQLAPASAVGIAFDPMAPDAWLRAVKDLQPAPSSAPDEATDDGMATDEDILRALCGEAMVAVRELRDPAADELAYRLSQAWRGDDPTDEGYFPPGEPRTVADGSASIIRHRKDLGLTTEEIAWLDNLVLAVLGEYNSLNVNPPPRIASLLKAHSHV